MLEQIWGRRYVEQDIGQNLGPMKSQRTSAECTGKTASGSENFLQLRWQRGNEFQAEAVTVARANDGRNSGVDWGIEFDFQQIARVQKDACIQHHAALAEFCAAPLDDRGRKTLRRYDADVQVHGKAVPTAFLF